MNGILTEAGFSQGPHLAVWHIQPTLPDAFQERTCSGWVSLAWESIVSIFLSLHFSSVFNSLFLFNLNSYQLLYWGAGISVLVKVMVWAFHASHCSSRDGRGDSWVVTLPSAVGILFLPSSSHTGGWWTSAAQVLLVSGPTKTGFGTSCPRLPEERQKLVPTNIFLYRYIGILNVQPYQKFLKLILAGRGYISENFLNLLPTQSLKYIEVYFCSTYLNQLSQLQVLNNCMISKVGVFKITFL